MEKITAYKDSAGRLHERAQDAIEWELVYKFRSIWKGLHDVRDLGDPVIIARSFADYPVARQRLREALEWFDAALAQSQ